MAIFHLTTHPMSRAKGHSAVAGAAYRAGVSLVDERTGEVHDYSRKGGVLSAEIVTPDGVPVPERGELWNKAEAAEKRKDARVAREWRVALPASLDEVERKALALELGKAIADRYGVAVDVCIHAPDSQGDERNFHAHMLATTRTIGPDGELGGKSIFELGNKDRLAQGIEGTSSSDLVEIRAMWADFTNKALERAGHSERIDHRSYKDQGIELTPTTHIGPTAQAMARRGAASERVEMHQAARDEQARQIIENPEIVLEKITATQAVFSKRDIARELNRYIDDPDQFQNLLAKLEASAQLIELEPSKKGQPAKLSTREMVAVERSMVDAAERMYSATGTRISQQHINGALGAIPTLSTEQANAIRHVTDPEKIAIIIGDAGTGKSFSMKVAREIWEAKGLRVRGAALAGKAADELQEGSGINSRTLASLEHAWKRGKDKLTKNDVLVIDEAGMIGSRQLGRILETADKAGAKVVLLGDDKQLAAIEAGAAFRAVVDRVGAAEITQIRRQKESWAREASQEFARGSVAAGMAAYAQRGHVHMHDDKGAARQALARAYVADAGKGSQIVLAHSNKDVQALNEAIRAERQAAGTLGQGVRVQTDRGGRDFAQGDRIVFLRNDSGVQVKNGTLGTVEQTEGGMLSVRLDNGERREINPEQYGAIDHGYAVTVHKAQGVTVDRAYLLATPGMDRSLTYVGMTRHREEANLFASAEDFPSKRGGVLVAHGRAPYQHKAENSGSYFATVRDGQGKEHTTWGVDLERAFAASGVKPGERIELEHVGAETVTLPSGATARRNTWTVHAGERTGTDELAAALGRQRPKESTLDFADRRGFDGAGVVRRMIEKGREKLAAVAGRLELVTRTVLEKAGRKDQALAPLVEPVAAKAPEPMKWVRPSKRAALAQQEAAQGAPEKAPAPVSEKAPAAPEKMQEMAEAKQEGGELAAMIEQSRRDHAEMQAARAAEVERERAAAAAEIEASRARLAQQEAQEAAKAPEPMKWVRPSKRAALAQQEAAQGAPEKAPAPVSEKAPEAPEKTPQTLAQQKAQVIEDARAADPERRALAEPWRRQFEGRPVEQIEKQHAAWHQEADRARRELSTLNFYEDPNNGAGPLRQASISLTRAEMDHKAAWAAMERWEEANKVKAALGMGGTTRRELEAEVNTTADQLEKAQRENAQVRAEHGQNKASAKERLEKAEQYTAGLAALVAERIAEQRALAKVGPQISDEQAAQNYSQMVTVRSSQIRGKATRLAARIESRKELVENAIRSHQRGKPQEPGGLAAMVPGAKAKYRDELERWEAQDKALGKRSGELMRRGRVAQRYRSELDADKAAAKKVSRENPVLRRRVLDIEERAKQEARRMAQERTKQRQRERGRDRGPYRGR